MPVIPYKDVKDDAKKRPWQYRITRHGSNWVDRWSEVMPVAKYLAELTKIENSIKQKIDG